MYPAYGVTGRVHPNDSYNSDFTYKEFTSSEGAGNGGQILSIVWSPWRVRYAVGSALTPPTATQTGSIKIRVTNRAPTTWRAGGTNRYRLGYHVYAANGTTLVDWNGGQVDLPQDVSWGETVTVTVPLAALPVGEYQIKFDMLQSGVRWFSEEAIHPDLMPLAIRVSVGNMPPAIQSAAPAGQTDTRTPTLSVVGVNPDSYPSGALQYYFRICEDEAMTVGCQTTAWMSSNRWSPPNLKWATTYLWRADGRLEHAGARSYQPTDPDTGLPTGTERGVLHAAAQFDAVGNPIRTFGPTDVFAADLFDGTTLAGDWQSTGSWSVAGGELNATAAGLVWQPGATDGQVSVTADGSGKATLVFRVADSSNYIEVNWSVALFGLAWAVTVNAVVDGVKQRIDQAHLPGDSGALEEGDRVDVSFFGDQVRVFRNGALHMETRLPADTAGTGVGVAATAAGQGAAGFRFDAYRRSEASFDVYGRQVSSTVDPGGAGLRTEQALLPDGRPEAVFRSNTTEPGAVAETRFGYDPVSGMLAWSENVVSDPDPEVAGDELRARTTQSRDQRGLVTATTSPEGSQVDFAYDEIGQLSQVTGPAQTVERYGQSPQPGVRPIETLGYTAFGELSAVEDAAGRQTQTSIDDRGLPVEVTLPPYTPPGGGAAVERVVSTGFDDSGRVVSQTDPLGEVTELTYNSLGLLVARQDPAVGGDPAGVWRYTYDDMGWLQEQRDPNGAVARQRWDDLGRVTAVEEIVRQPELASHVSASSFGDAGGVLRSRTAEGVVSTSEYDAVGRLARQLDADGNATTFGYDGLGRPERVTGPDGRQARTAYDLVGNRVVEQAYGPDGTTLLGESRSAWDLDGRLVSMSSPRGVAEGFATGLVYDDAGQLTGRTTPVGPGQTVTESWGYDELGQATRYTDGRNNTTWQTYNAMGLPQDAIDPAAGTHTAVADRQWRTVYDAAGRPTAQQAPGGVSVSSSYDELGRLVEQAGAGAQAATATRSFDYDPAGRLVAASTPAGAQTFSYDDRGLMLASEGVSGDSSFAYDGDSRMTRRTDSSGVTEVAYDIRGLPESMTSSLSGTVGFDFDEAGRPTTVDYGDGTTRAYTYDDWGRVDTDRLTTGAAELYGVDYGYDLDGNITSKQVTGTGVPAAGLNQYSYDWASRITSWTDPASIAETYTWDATSNRTQAGAVTSTYDEQNRLTRSEGPGGLTTNTWAANGTLDEQRLQRRVSLVVGDPANLTPAEAVLLWNTVLAGNPVTLLDDNAAVPTTGVDVFMLSPSVDTAAVAAKYKDVAVPVVNLAAGTWQANGLTSAAPTGSSSGSAHVGAPGHPVAAGKTGTVTLLTSPDTVSSVPVAALGAGATRVWTRSSASTDTVVAVYDTGAATPGGAAAERRVAVGLSAGAVAKINSDGWAVIAAAIVWADNNTATFGTTNFDFDAFEQLSRITTPDATVSDHTYDPLGRRLTSPSGALTYAGTAIRPSADGATRYQPGPLGATAIDDLTDGAGQWAHADGHTDVVASFTPGDTSPTGAQTFTPWGQPQGATGTPLPLGYQSERQDLPGGLIAMGAREYDPTTGTFITHDPIVDPAVPNGYSYTPANPMGYIDPLGLDARDVQACINWRARSFNPRPYAEIVARCTQAEGRREQESKQQAREDRDLDDKQNRVGKKPRHENQPPAGGGSGGGGSGSGGSSGGSGGGGGPSPRWGQPPAYIPPPPPSPIAQQVAATGSAVPNYPGRIQRDPATGQIVDTGNASIATPPVMPVINRPVTPTTPDIVIEVVSAEFPVGGVSALGPTDWNPLEPLIDEFNCLMGNVSRSALGEDPTHCATNGIRRPPEPGPADEGANVQYELAEGLLSGTWEMTFADYERCLENVSDHDIITGSCALVLVDITPADEAFHVIGAFNDARRVGESLQNAAEAARLTARACSFSGDTEVLMADGSKKPISEVEIGDTVLAKDPETGETGSRQVSHVLVHADKVVDLELDSGVVTTTEDHPFWSQTDKQWQEAQHLDIGDRLLAADGGSVTVEGLDRSTGRMAVAYNLTVKDLHTYFVVIGDSAELVHNECLTALRTWSSRRFQFGNATFLLGRVDMTHILRRHHPDYWDGSNAAVQTFFDDGMSVADVEDAIAAVAGQNRDELISIGAGWGQVTGVYNGQSYVLGVNNGHLGQFFPSLDDLP